MLIQKNTNIVTNSIGFDSRSEFLFTDGSMGRNVIIFGADKSSSVHADNKNKAALIFC